MYKIWIEYSEETIPLDTPDQEGESLDWYQFQPLCGYKKPIDIEDVSEFSVDFNPEHIGIIHLVVVAFDQEVNKENIPKWAVVSIHPSRRAALAVKKQIEIGEYKGEKPWDAKDCMFDYVQVVTIPIED